MIPHSSFPVMAALFESEKTPSPSPKENMFDSPPILPSNDPEKVQPTDPKVLRRATFKIDIYLIPIIGMFSVSSLPLDSPVIVMGSPLV
jgi:hypothetical protein